MRIACSLLRLSLLGVVFTGTVFSGTLLSACTVDDRAVSTEPLPLAGSDEAAGGDNGGSTGSPPAQRTTNGSGGGSTQMSGGDPAATTGPFERELEGLVVQSAPWADVLVKVTGARLYRGPRPRATELPARYAFSEQNVYAILDINISVLGNRLADYTERQTWDLILADGTRLAPVNPLGVTVATGDSPTVHSYYLADEATDLRAAALEVNGSDRAGLEPLRIPLDAEQVFESQSELTSLVGQVIAPMGEGELSFEVLEAYYGVNLVGAALRASRDQRLVLLNTRVGYSGLFSESFSSVPDGPKVSVNGNTLSSLEGDIVTIPTGQSIDLVTRYEFDEAATRLDVLFDTGDEAFVRIPVELPPAPQ